MGKKKHRPDDHQMSDHGGGNHHAQMVADFRRRFWISLVLTVPILVLSPLVQGFLGQYPAEPGGGRAGHVAQHRHRGGQRPFLERRE